MPSSIQTLKRKKRALFKSLYKRALGQKTSSNTLSLAIVDPLLNLSRYGPKPTVASYRAMPGEISPTLFEQKCPKSVRLVYPQFRAGNMVFVPSSGKWEKGPWPHFFQPAGQGSKPTISIDMMLIPGLAFDREGRRLGRGAGFYDRFLSQHSAVKIGLAQTWQISNSPLPEEAHDIRMDIVVTESYLFIPLSKNILSRW